MRNVLLIAKREYLEQVRGRSFRFSTALVPLLAALLLAGDSLTMRHADLGEHIAIAASDPQLANAIKGELLAEKGTGFTVDVVAPDSDSERAALRGEVRGHSIDGLLTIDAADSGSPKYAFISLSNGAMGTVARLKEAMQTAMARRRLLAIGTSEAEIDQVFKDISIETLRLNKQDKIVKASGIAALEKVIVMLLLILMPIVLHGMDMARAIIEEKNSRIFEVLLSVTRAEESLAGKLLGTVAVGITQIAVWGAVVVFVSGSAALGSMLGGSLDLHVTWTEIVFFAIYFILGFLLYNAIFSGLGATCETAQDLQMYALLTIFPVWLAMFTVSNVINRPGSSWNVFASLFPITSPFVMVPRLGIETVPVWQTAASLAILVLSIWIALRLSARIYRMGILMYGKRATLPEILRWLRSS